MILQKLKFPGDADLSGKLNTEEASEVRKLYWRSKGEVFFDRWNRYTEKPNERALGQQKTCSGINMKKAAKLECNTYFNCFSCGKWKKYTEVEEVVFRIRGTGRFRIELYHICLKEGNVCRKKLYNSIIAGSGATVPIRLDGLTGSLYSVMTALADSVLLGACWETPKEPLHPVCLAAVICTYKKEAYVKRNLEILKSLPESALTHIYVVDNGKTLTKPDNTNVTVIPNKNSGGSGGFARGIQAVLNGEGICQEEFRRERDGEEKFTHMLLMDDDVVIEEEAIQKMRAFLAYEKQEYHMNLLGGAMLRLDYPYIQHEAGGTWNDGWIHSIHQGLDLRRMWSVLKNEMPEQERADYAAWWFCCIPVLYAEKYGMPMPYFLHCDDIEYSLRGSREPIYLNGIAVWHEQFENKRYSATEYYDVRNMLFTNQLHRPGFNKRKMAFAILYKVYANLIRYRYRDAELVLRAVEDYRKGFEWLRQTDGEKLHREIGELGYQLTEPEKVLRKEIEQEKGERRGKSGNSSKRSNCCRSGIQKRKPELQELYRYKGKGKRRILNLLTLNGFLLPAKKGRKWIMLGAPAEEYFRVKEAWLYDPENGKGIMVRKRIGEAWKSLGRLSVMLCEILR